MTTPTPKAGGILAATGFQYRGYSADDVVARANQNTSMYDSYVDPQFKFFKAPEGQSQIRILPATFEPPKGEKPHYGYPIYLHFSVGAGKGQTYLCPNKMKGERCPVCEEWHRLEGANVADANDLAPQRRVIFWMIDRKDEKAGPKLWYWAPTRDKDIAMRSQVRRTGAVLVIDHPDEGYDIYFTRTGTTFNNTKYIGWEIDREATPLHEDERVAAEWLKFVTEHPLPNILQFYPAEYLEQVLSGGVDPQEPQPAPTAATTVRGAALPAAAEPKATETPAPAAAAAPVAAQPAQAPATAPAPAALQAPVAGTPSAGGDSTALAAVRAKIQARRGAQPQS